MSQKKKAETDEFAEGAGTRLTNSETQLRRLGISRSGSSASASGGVGARLRLRLRCSPALENGSRTALGGGGDCGGVKGARRFHGGYAVAVPACCFGRDMFRARRIEGCAWLCTFTLARVREQRHPFGLHAETKSRCRCRCPPRCPPGACRGEKGRGTFLHLSLPRLTTVPLLNDEAKEALIFGRKVRRTLGVCAVRRREARGHPRGARTGSADPWTPPPPPPRPLLCPLW